MKNKYYNLRSSASIYGFCKKKLLKYLTKWHFIIIIPIIFIIIGFEEIFPHYDKYINNDCNFKIKYPEEWSYEEFEDTQELYKYIVFFNNTIDTSNFISIILYNFTNLNLESIKEFKKLEYNITSFFGDIEKSKIFKVDKIPSLKMIYTTPHVVEISNIIPRKIMEINILFLPFIYEVKFFAINKDVYKDNIKIFKKMLSSIDIDKNRKEKDYIDCLS